MIRDFSRFVVICRCMRCWLDIDRFSRFRDNWRNSKKCLLCTTQPWWTVPKHVCNYINPTLEVRFKQLCHFLNFSSYRSFVRFRFEKRCCFVSLHFVGWPVEQQWHYCGSGNGQCQQCTVDAVGLCANKMAFWAFLINNNTIEKSTVNTYWKMNQCIFIRNYLLLSIGVVWLLRMIEVVLATAMIRWWKCSRALSKKKWFVWKKTHPFHKQ